MLIRDILRPGLKSINHDATMAEAEQYMKRHVIRHLPVMNGTKIVGILSDRDILKAMNIIDNQEYMQKHKKVIDFMSSPVISINMNENVQKLVREMLDSGVSSMIVSDDYMNPVGIITSHDLLILLQDLLDSKNTLWIKIKNIFS